MTKVDTIEKLAIMMTEGFSALETRMDEHFDAVDAGFDRIEGELTEIRRILERVDTRLAALELAVFGATRSDGGRISTHSILERLEKLEQRVYHT